MKLLLTSTGLRNDSQLTALRDMLDRPFEASNVAVVPTASLAEPGDHGWFVRMLSDLHAMHWREFDVVELNGLPPAVVLDRLRRADVVYASGGNHYHLARSISGNGLTDGFRELLDSRVYVGMSAGSMIFSRNLTAHSADVIGDTADLHLLGATEIESPFGLFDWYVKPHLDSPDFPERDDAWADRIVARADFPIYFIDDDTAIQVRDGGVEVVSEGRWRFHP